MEGNDNKGRWFLSAAYYKPTVLALFVVALVFLVFREAQKSKQHYWNKCLVTVISPENYYACISE